MLQIYCLVKDFFYLVLEIFLDFFLVAIYKSLEVS